MKTFHALGFFRNASAAFVAVAVMGASGSALAQAAAPPAEPPVAAASTGLQTVPIGRARLSFSVVPAPLGSVETTFITNTSTDTAFAFGFRPALDYSFNDYFFVGVSPQLMLNVKGDNYNGDAGKALDLLLRVGGHAPVAERIHLYGFLSPGYSVIYPDVGNNPSGFVLGVTAGGMYALNEKLFASADIGYQLGYQEVTIANADLDFRLRYLLIGLGIGMKL
jgi:hypothetical protein